MAKKPVGAACDSFGSAVKELLGSLVALNHMRTVGGISLWPKRGSNLKKILYIQSTASVFTFFKARARNSLFFKNGQAELSGIFNVS